MRRHRRTKSNRRTLKKILKIISISIFSVIMFGVISSCIIFYAPFQATRKVRDLIVTTAMATMTHQYIAKLFLSDAEIQKILDDNTVKPTNEKTDESAITVYSNKDTKDEERLGKDNSDINDIKLINITGKTAGKTFKGYLLEVKDPSRIKLGYTDKLGKIGLKLNEMNSLYHAVGGINAGGFVDVKGIGNGGVPTGIIISDHKVVFGFDSELSYRKKYGEAAVPPKETKENIIGFDDNNVLILGLYTLREAEQLHIRDAISFFPYLIVNGKPQIIKGDGGWGINPRTAIGQTKDGTVLLLVIDGRQISSIGVTLKDIQDIMLKYGAVNAANLDGGSSSTMYLHDKLINHPCSSAGERYLPTAFMILPSQNGNDSEEVSEENYP
ncbi:MAG: phosphodiester glycosidase family protein [Bacillota bacterium]|nr:phosphodiester glycosidase family protein [Bacillota bacterium]